MTFGSLLSHLKVERMISQKKRLVSKENKQMGVTVELPNGIFRKFYLTFLFCFFLLPLSSEVGGDGVSANYLFILFPVSVAFISGKLIMPSQTLRDIVFLYVLIFIVSIAYQFSYFQFMDRRVSSFILFMSMFVFIFIKIDSQMVQAFKIAIVSVAIIFSLGSIYSYFSLGGADLGYLAKGAVGSQRFGFVFVVAIWLLFYYSPKYTILSVVKYIGLLVVWGGLILTFSRSGIIALFGSMSMFILNKAIGWVKKQKLPSVSQFLSTSLFVLALVASFFALYLLFQVAFNFYGERLFSLSQASGADTYVFDDQESSEGYRVFLFQKIMEFITHNPITGSGYLGVWILFDDLSGSAHNQYLDVLFRTGLFGFLAHIYLLYRLLMSFYFREPGLFWGLISMLVYGLFHETFKLSYGMFMLSFMLGMMMQYRRANYLDSPALPHSQSS